MKWLLSKLGLLKQHKKTKDLKDDLSFFETSRAGQCHCMSMAFEEANAALAQAKQRISVEDQN